jgi:hypothetical protein
MLAQRLIGEILRNALSLMQQLICKNSNTLLHVWLLYVGRDRCSYPLYVGNRHLSLDSDHHWGYLPCAVLLCADRVSWRYPTSHSICWRSGPPEDTHSFFPISYKQCIRKRQGLIELPYFLSKAEYGLCIANFFCRDLSRNHSPNAYPVYFSQV